MNDRGQRADSNTAAVARGIVEPALEVIDVSHHYGEVVALDGVSFSSPAGEFLTLLGESGSGKTTLLRIVAGLEKPQRVGRIAIFGETVTDVPASGRSTTTVFQHYALFPHMSVGENVEYGLRVRGIGRQERRERASDTLRLVRLGDKYDRRIHQLSGGERQRVALARALVTRPAILLLDEPLGALDEKLRGDMQTELKQLHDQLGITFVYVTHSQEEALTMSNRILLMRRGRIVQEGSPQTILERPISRFVAEFMGVDNLLEGTLEQLTETAATVRVRGQPIQGVWCGRDPVQSGTPVCVAIRAEHVHVHTRTAPSQNGEVNCLPCRSVTSSYRGKFHQLNIDSDIGPLCARIWGGGVPDAMASFVSWKVSNCCITSIA